MLLSVHSQWLVIHPPGPEGHYEAIICIRGCLDSTWSHRLPISSTQSTRVQLSHRRSPQPSQPVRDL